MNLMKKQVKKYEIDYQELKKNFFKCENTYHEKKDKDNLFGNKAEVKYRI